MNIVFLRKLSESIQNNDSESYSLLLENYPLSISCLSAENNSNIFHELSNSRMNEKYILPFLEITVSTLSTKVSGNSIPTLLNSQVTSDEKLSPLHLSILRGKLKLSKRYLELGADPKITTDIGRNVLHLCAETGMLGLFLYVKEQYNMGIETLDSKGFNALHLAIGERREEMAMLILSLSSNLNVGSRKALEMAVNTGSYKITRHLLIHRKGKSLELKGLNLKSEDKDIRKLLVRNIQKKKKIAGKNKNWLILLLFALITKESNYWAMAYLNFQSTYSSLSNSIESSFRITTLLLLIVLAIILSVLNPGHELRDEKTNLHVIITQELYEKYIPEYICPYCSLKKHKGTKHCQTCQKCVREYDHHCKWINNCVGQNNLKYFGAFLLILFMNLCFSVVIGSLMVFNDRTVFFENVGKTEYLECLTVYGFTVNFMIMVVLVPVLVRWIIKLKKKDTVKTQVGKDPLLQNADYMKGFRDLENEATSDTASMFIKETLDSNSESASSGTFVSQFFSNRSQ